MEDPTTSSSSSFILLFCFSPQQKDGHASCVISNKTHGIKTPKKIEKAIREQLVGYKHILGYEKIEN